MKSFLKYAIANGGNVVFLDCDFTSSRGTTNPSIIKHNGKTLLSLRSCEYTFLNYRFGFAQNGKNISWYPLYVYNNVPVNFLSRNYICELDEKTLGIKKHKEILVWQDRSRYCNGAEDIRLFQNDKNIFASYSIYEEDEGVSMNISALDDIEYGTIETNTYRPEKFEKNWMPIIGKHDMFVRKAFGDIVQIKDVKPEHKDKKIKHIGKIDAPLDYRGSTQLWPYQDGYICIVHQNFLYENNGIGSMQYLHKFIMTNNEYKVTKESEWFTFIGMPIEFTCGMLLDNDKCMIPFSVFDSATFLIETDIKTIIDFINDVEKKNEFIVSKDELHNIVSTKNGNDFLLSIDKFIIDNTKNNVAAKIACMTHSGTISENKNFSKEMYVKALCEIKKFDIGMRNSYTHMLIGQDLIRDTLEKFYKN